MSIWIQVFEILLKKKQAKLLVKMVTIYFFFSFNTDNGIVSLSPPCYVHGSVDDLWLVNADHMTGPCLGSKHGQDAGATANIQDHLVSEHCGVT